MAPGGSEAARNRSTRTCDCRKTAKKMTGAMTPKAISVGRSRSRWLRGAPLARGGPKPTLRMKAGSWTSAISTPPTATPAAAARTPHRACRATMVPMIPTLYET